VRPPPTTQTSALAPPGIAGAVGPAPSIQGLTDTASSNAPVRGPGARAFRVGLVAAVAGCPGVGPVARSAFRRRREQGLDRTARSPTPQVARSGSERGIGNSCGSGRLRDPGPDARAISASVRFPATVSACLGEGSTQHLQARVAWPRGSATLSPVLTARLLALVQDRSLARIQGVAFATREFPTVVETTCDRSLAWQSHQPWGV
jgi:hypothetical protein